MNRPRKKGNRDLPPNLYAAKTGYFSYRHPATGKYHGMGNERTQAILAAQQLNSVLMVKYGLVDKVLGKTNLFTLWLDKYLKIRHGENRLAEKSKKLFAYDVKLMREQLGQIPIADLSVFHCAEFLDLWLDQGKRRMASRLRSQLIKCLDYAVSQGVIDQNPASKTLPVTVKTERKRLTKDQFDAIYKIAPVPIRNAMMLALITLQRREDVAVMKFRHIKDGYLYVRQQKTAKGKGKRSDSTNDAAHLMIEVTPQLQAIIKQCRETGVVSHYMIHHIHGRRSAGATHTKVEPGMKLQPDNITRGFATARNRTELFAGMKPSERPTFHEIRSLGATLYKAQGIDPQALLGHTDPKMTGHYLDGHGIRWTVVQAGLNV